MSIFHQSFSQLTRLFLANACPICDRSTTNVLCPNCYRQISACQQRHQATSTQGLPQTSHQTLPVFAWGHYQGLLKQALTLLKYGHQAELGVWLGLQLGEHWRTHHHNNWPKETIVVPIPLHRERQQQRGYNQAALIAQGFCRATGLSHASHGLRRIKNTQAMHSLGIKERHANLDKAFQLGKGLPSPRRPILLIDDIYTTGTTALAAAAALSHAGYTVSGITTVARTAFESPGQRPSKPVRRDQTPNLNPTL